VIAVLEATTLPGIPLPGVKYGLGNIPLLFGIGLVGFGDLVAIALLRIGIAGLLTGGLNVMNLALSIGGTAAALGVVGLAGGGRPAAPRPPEPPSSPSLPLVHSWPPLTSPPRLRWRQ
jgi:hypothetical protein